MNLPATTTRRSRAHLRGRALCLAAGLATLRHRPKAEAWLSLGVLLASLVAVGGLDTPRALAGDASQGACPNESSPGFRAYLPDCRGYELVTPPYTEGYQVFVVGISDEATRLRGESFGSFAGAKRTSVFGESYTAVRTESEWKWSPFDVPFASFPTFRVKGTSADLASSFVTANPPGGFLEQDLYVGPSSGLTSVGPGSPPGTRLSGLRYEGASADLSRIVLGDHSLSGGEAENQLWPGDETFAGGGDPSLYEYAGTGNTEPTLVGVSNVGRPPSVAAGSLISRCGTLLGSDPEGDEYNAVSASGGAVFFTAEACGGSPAVNEVYARIDGERTAALSEPLAPTSGAVCTGACATAEPRSAVFVGASSDGSKAFFLTSQPLVNGDTDTGTDLYEAEIAGAKVTRLVQVSRGGEGDPTPGAGANVLGMARVSEDGSHVYFVAEGVLTGADREGNAPVAGEPNLYAFSSECPGGGTVCASPIEHISFVGTLSTQDAEDWSLADFREVQASVPDGRFLVFHSTADLTADQEGQPEAGQVFEYDARTESLVRVSRGRDGFNNDGNSSSEAATIPRQVFLEARPERELTGLAVTADGSRVFFTSTDALTPEAAPGTTNVYEYHEGIVYLISDGQDAFDLQGTPDTELIGTDQSGRDAFFTTADPLVPQAAGTQRAVYDARTDGGFPAASGSAPCSGSCRGAPTPPVVLPEPAAPAASSESSTPAPAAAPVAKPKATPVPNTNAHKRKRKKHRRRGKPRGR